MKRRYRLNSFAPATEFSKFPTTTMSGNFPDLSGDAVVGERLNSVGGSRMSLYKFFEFSEIII